VVEKRTSLLRRMTTFGVRFISGTDAGIAPGEARQIRGRGHRAWPWNRHCACARRCVQQRSWGVRAGPVEGVSSARHDADVIVVDGDLAADLTALRDVRQAVLRGVPASPRSGQS
jgi:hypothetical protein